MLGMWWPRVNTKFQTLSSKVIIIIIFIEGIGNGTYIWRERYFSYAHIIRSTRHFNLLNVRNRELSIPSYDCAFWSCDYHHLIIRDHLKHGKFKPVFFTLIGKLGCITLTIVLGPFLEEGNRKNWWIALKSCWRNLKLNCSSPFKESYWILSLIFLSIRLPWRWKDFQ